MDNINELSFEVAYEQLTQVVERLESGEHTLEESVKLYEQGRLLSARCQALLEDAELRISKLNDDQTLTPLE